MHPVPVRAVILAVAALQLGGCSSFLGLKFAHRPKAEPATAAPALATAATLTETGRRQLAAGQPGLAIESFQKALASSEAKAPALNGMGVAFARLGRYDLAQRFFTQAMAIDPADSRYADNMTRLMRSPNLAMRRDGDVAATAARQAMAPAQAAAPAVGQIQRLSRGEVRIAFAPPQAQPVARSTRSASAEGFKPVIRVAFADQEPEQAKGFVRIVLPTPAATGKTASK